MSELAHEEAFTDDEVEAARAAIREAGKLAAKKLLARAKANLPVRRDDLVYVTQYAIAWALNFAIEHVKRRAVLRDEPSIAERALTPIWRGVHEVGRLYGPNDLVTAKGSLWIALTATAETPGAGATSWRLAVKGR